MKYDPKRIYEWPIIPRSIVIAIVCVIILYLGQFLDFSRMNQKLKALELQEQDLKAQLASLSTSLHDVKNELIRFSSLPTILVEKQKELITSKEIPELLNDILKIGKGNELEITSFKPEAETKAQNFDKIAIKMQMVGTYDQIANFFSQVATMNKLIVLGNFILAKPETAASATNLLDNRIMAQMILEVYKVNKT